jgi:prepilin-type N-terminal cleavage/methylation domain-containing protein
MRRGFTLIELLVVIAIIGVLSAVVLASLNSARQKGTDAAIQANIQTIQTQAEVYYDVNRNYGTVNQTLCPNVGGCINTMWCGDVPSNVPVMSALVALKNLSGAANVNCNSSPTAYAVSARLASNSSYYWCLDSAGKIGTTSATTLSGPSCP